MGVFHAGSIKYNRFSNAFSEDKGHFFLFASSNRCNNLIYKDFDECNESYRLSILPYVGAHNDIVPQWSNRKDHVPVILDNIEAPSDILSVDKKNVRLVSAKKAEDIDDAIVFRFIETEGIAVSTELKPFFKPERAFYTDNIERDVAVAEIEENKVIFDIEPYSYVTLKIYIGSV